jgi:hypothetical protein
MKKDKAQTKSTLTIKSIRDSPVLSDLIEKQIDEARDSARKELGEMIGQGNWKTASNTKIHPAEQVPIRYTCKRCEMVGTKYQTDECLDFAGTFGHTCPRKIKGFMKDTVDWRANMFQIDSKVG